MTDLDWLPALIEFDGDWNRLDEYVDRVYAVFVRDFVAQRPPMLDGLRISLRRHPEFQNRSFTFWHVVTEGKVEENRYPVIERCRRIAWARAILERVGKAPLRRWRNQRGRDARTLIALPDFSYLVVLDEREDKADGHRYFLLLSAYPIEQEHRREKLRAEHDAWHRGRTKG